MTRRPDYTAEARDYIARAGREQAQAVADAEIQRAVFDVTYPFGRIGLYQAVREQLEATQ
jgi:hypothetical protein